MFQIIPMMWCAVRPSKVVDMPARANPFWLPKGYEGLTFFGYVLTPSQAEADRFNAGFSSLKNHEMIHLRQAQSCGDSWLRFYLLYIWYWLKGKCRCRQLRKKVAPQVLPKNIAYLLNPFEMEAYANMHDLDYLGQFTNGATGWQQYVGMPMEQRLRLFLEHHRL